MATGQVAVRGAIALEGIALQVSFAEVWCATDARSAPVQTPPSLKYKCQKAEEL